MDNLRKKDRLFQVEIPVLNGSRDYCLIARLYKAEDSAKGRECFLIETFSRDLTGVERQQTLEQLRARSQQGQRYLDARIRAAQMECAKVVQLQYTSEDELVNKVEEMEELLSRQGVHYEKLPVTVRSARRI